MLSAEQSIAYDFYKSKKNVFVTGPGGSGKSELIRTIYKDATEQGKKIKVVSLTGSSALLLKCNATTVHSFFGLGVSLKGTIQYIASKAKTKQASQIKWIQILVIDEISMMSAKLFDVLNLIAKKIRKNDEPFGGIQLVFSGDFFQLPPIGEDEYTKKFCFESVDWEDLFGSNKVALKTIFRQSDNEYVKILNQIRKGRLTRKSYETLLKYVGRTYTDDIQPIQLFPRRHMVEGVNNKELKKLEGNEHRYLLKEYSSYSTGFTREEIENEKKLLLNSIPCERELVLKVGCRVLCIVNLDLEGEFPICNGSAGKVARIDESTGYPIVKFTEGQETLIEPHQFVSENIATVRVCQLPLILAYSISIHRSQGCGFKEMEVDIGDTVFEDGQTYVALSRLKDLNGLYIKSLDVHKIKANEKVIEFYKKNFDDV